MNKFAAALLFTFLSSASLAGDIQAIPNDDTPYTAICVASLESEAALQSELQEHGIAQSDAYDLTCNGYRLNRFASKVQDSAQVYAVPARTFAALGTNSDAEKLCIAAATSNQAFDQLKNELLTPAEESSLYALECNGKSLHHFARRNGNTEFRI